MPDIYSDDSERKNWSFSSICSGENVFILPEEL
jgi:hypothetical protein